MDDQSLPTIRHHADGRRSRHGVAFFIEALVLLVFLIWSLAVLAGLMESVQTRGTTANELSAAVILASNDAEEFSASPTVLERTARYRYSEGTLTELESDGALLDEPDKEDGNGRTYDLVRTVEQSGQPAGTLFKAHIEVSHHGRTVYSLETSRYISNEEVVR